MLEKPDEFQKRAAKVRAVSEAYYKKHRKPYLGGYLVPSSEKVYKVIAKITGETVRAVNFCMTYSRSCAHPWSKGACADCPSADHIPW